MIYNQTIPNNIGEKWYSRKKYYEYLTILSTASVENISIRNVFPKSQRRTGKKTMFSLFNKPILTIDTENYNEYYLSFDGKTVRKNRI